jgi:hypothetical protein
MVRSMRAFIVAVAALIIFAGCTVERKPGYDYTVTGQNLGATNWHEISRNESHVSFTGSDPVKKREAESLIDRYEERITFNNNSIFFYTKSYHLAFSGTFSDEDFIERAMSRSFYKDKGIVYDASKVKKTSFFKYIVQSSDTYHCFVFHGVFAQNLSGEARVGSPGNVGVEGNICATIKSKSAAQLEAEMLTLLDRARYDDGEGNRSAGAS